MAADGDQAVQVRELMPIVVPNKFGGTAKESVTRFLKQFERAAFANQWTEETKLAYLPCYLEGAALDVYDELEAEDLTYEDACQRLKEAFQTAQLEEKAFFDLTTRKQRWNEDVQEFISEMVRLCLRVNPTMDEKEKTQYVLRALNDKRVVEKVALMDNTTVVKLRKNIMKVEMSQRLMNEQGGSPGPSGSSGRQPMDRHETQDQSYEIRKLQERIKQLETTQGRRNNSNYYKYPSHQNSVEPKREIKRERTEDGRVICFSCNRPGHYARNCTAKNDAHRRQ